MFTVTASNKDIAIEIDLDTKIVQKQLIPLQI
jgi:hypothetical protein